MADEQAPGKRYYWLKLQDGFFNSKRIKKLRKLAGGDTYTIIYLKMQLLAIKTEGVLRWTGLEDDIASELALDLDEEPDNVEVTLRFLLAHGLAEGIDGSSFFLPYAVENTGSETSAAKRMRDMRARNGVTPQSNAVTLPSNIVTPERNNVTQASQCDAAVTHALRERYGEKEIEKESEKEKEKEIPASTTRARETGKVMDFYLDKINPTPSSYCVDMLKGYTADLGADVVLHALGVALDERKTGWSYIQAILQRYSRDGLKSMEDVLRSEQEYTSGKKDQKERSRPVKPNQIVGRAKSRFTGQQLENLLKGLDTI